ncbi:MAG: GAF domain-containing protein [Anaerolineae bacterium]|nr:GAF domain-containing protein [Anaerolineae bacterium]
MNLHRPHIASREPSPETDDTAQANQARIAELIALQRIGRELNSTFDMGQILDLLIREVVSLTPATHGSVLLHEPQTAELLPSAWYGYDQAQIDAIRRVERVPERGITYRVLTTGQPAVVDDVRRDPAYIALLPTSRSELAVPIRYGTEIVGVIDLESPSLGAFHPEHQRFVEAIAEQAAIAIGNAQRYAEQVAREDAARQRSAQLRDLIEISHILHSEHALDDVLDRIVQAIPATGGFRVAVLSLVEGTPPVVRRVAAAGIPLDVFQALQEVRQPLEDLVQVFQEQYQISQSYFLPHQERGQWEIGLSPYTLLRERDEWQEGDWHPDDVLLIPLRDSHGRLMGWLSVDDPFDARVPTVESIEVLELFANEAASAIENARLYDEQELRVRKRTAELAHAMRRQALEIEKTHAIVESISDAVLVFDQGGVAILANPAHAVVLGLPPGALLGHHLEEEHFARALPKDQEMLAAVFRTARDAREALAAGQDVVHTVFRAARRVIRVTFTPVPDLGDNPPAMVAVFRDVTAEAELDRIKSEFVSMAAHELRTPMSSITGYVDLLMLGMLGPINEQQTEFLQVVKDNAQRLMTLVQDLLDVNEIEDDTLRLTMESLSMSAVVAKSAMTLQHKIVLKDQQLVVDVPDSLPAILGDRDRMVQVVTNLLSNAHKYSPAGAKIEILGRCRNGRVEIDFVDAGIGIAPEDQKQLFKRFFRAPNAISTREDGTGLGLAICLEIVERHGGEIQVKSELGAGSTFRMILPARDDALQPHSSGATP